MTKLNRFNLVLTAAFVALNCEPSFAAGLGTDNANQSPYNSTWDSGDDGAAGGDGFLAWNLNASGGTGGFAGQFIGDSTTLNGGNTGANINVGGESFGMYANGAGDASANSTRSFTSDGVTADTLAVGQTFSIDLAVNFRNGFKGLDLRDASNTTIFNFNIAANDYRVDSDGAGAGGSVSIGDDFSTNTAFKVAFTQTSLSGGTWEITRSGGVLDSDNGTYTGVAGGFNLYIGATEGGDANNLFANNLSIVPEPGTYAMVAGGIGILIGIKRRRRC